MNAPNKREKENRKKTDKKNETKWFCNVNINIFSSLLNPTYSIVMPCSIAFTTVNSTSVILVRKGFTALWGMWKRESLWCPVKVTVNKQKHVTTFLCQLKLTEFGWKITLKGFSHQISGVFRVFPWLWSSPHGEKPTTPTSTKSCVVLSLPSRGSYPGSRLNNIIQSLSLPSCMFGGSL